MAVQRIIVNTYYNPHGTVGRILMSGKGKSFLDCWTIERPWKDNESFVSCIPAGVHKLEWHEPTDVSLPQGVSGTWAMVNHELGVSHYPEEGIDRNYCLFGHIANFPDDVVGCVGFGDDHRIFRNKLMVSNSSETTAKALTFIEINKVTEVEFIRHGVPEYNYREGV